MGCLCLPGSQRRPCVHHTGALQAVDTRPGMRTASRLQDEALEVPLFKD